MLQPKCKAIKGTRKQGNIRKTGEDSVKLMRA